jgi:hypothetical protein
MKRLKKINDLYKELNDMPEKSEQEWLRMNRFNTRAYRELFSEILDIRYYNPRLYLLAHVK